MVMNKTYKSLLNNRKWKNRLTIISKTHKNKNKWLNQTQKTVNRKPSNNIRRKQPKLLKSLNLSQRKN